jgi:hypothetical protein
LINMIDRLAESPVDFNVWKDFQFFVKCEGGFGISLVF